MVAAERDLDDVGQFSVSVAADQRVFKSGDAGGEVFIIQAGEVELLAEVDGAEVSVAHLEVGDFFGELSLLEAATHGVTAIALTDCKLLKIDRGAFDRIVEENPGIAVSMVRRLSRRLREHERALARALQDQEKAVEAEAAPAPEAGAPEAAPEAAEGEVAAAEEGTAAPAGEPAFVHTESGTEFRLPTGDEDVRIGREDPATGVVPDIDFSGVDSKRTLSRRHAAVVRRDGSYWLCEISAANGTFVNGKRLERGVSVKIEDGDEVRFGLVDTVFRFL